MLQRMIICISRTYGSGGRIVGQKLAESLGIPYYDKELLARMVREHGLDERILESIDEKPADLLSSGFPMGLRNPYKTENLDTLYYLMNDRIHHLLEQTIRGIAAQGSCVIIGRTADEILKDDPDLFSVFIHARLEDRIKRIMELEKLDAKSATRHIEKIDRKRASYYNVYSDKKWGESVSYDMTLSTSKFGYDGVVALIIQALGQLGAKR